jgi:hypothetical protein
MRKTASVIFCLAILFFAFPRAFAQSGKTPAGDTKKANRRPPATETEKPRSVETGAEDGSDDIADDDVINVDTNLVTVPVRVLDKQGRFVGGLSKEDFVVFEDRVQQEIAYFSNEQNPFTVALILDMSYSSTFKIDDRKAIVLFTDGVDTTSEVASLRDNLRQASELDALIYPIKYDTFADVQAIESGKVMVPDDPRTPRTTPPAGGGTIPTGGANPFPFPLPTGTISTGRSSRPSRIPGQGTTREEYETAGVYLDRLAMLTGGRIYEANSPENLSRAFSKIASELREFYSLGFYPNDAEEGRVRQLKVKVDKPGIAVRSRDSYVVKSRASTAPGRN